MQIICGVCQWKNFANWSVIGKDMDKSKVPRSFINTRWRSMDLPCHVACQRFNSWFFTTMSLCLSDCRVRLFSVLLNRCCDSVLYVECVVVFPGAYAYNECLRKLSRPFRWHDADTVLPGLVAAQRLPDCWKSCWPCTALSVYIMVLVHVFRCESVYHVFLCLVSVANWSWRGITVSDSVSFSLTLCAL